MRNLYRGPSKDASYQILIHLAKRLQRRRLFFRNEPIRNKNCLWRLCLSTDRDEMNNLYRGPSKDASHQISIHLAKRLQRRFFFRNQPIRNKNCLLRPCLLTDRDEMCTWRSRFRGEDFLEMNQSETRIVCGGHVCQWIMTKWAIFIEDLP